MCLLGQWLVSGVSLRKLKMWLMMAPPRMHALDSGTAACGENLPAMCQVVSRGLYHAYNLVGATASRCLKLEIYACAHAFMHMHKCVCVCVCMCVQIRCLKHEVHRRARGFMHIYVFVCVCVCTSAHTLASSDMKYIRFHLHAYVRVYVFMPGT